MDSKLIDKAGKLNEQIKKLNSELNDLKDELKSEDGVFNGSNYKASVLTYTKDTLDIEMATKVAMNNKLDWLLKTVINEEALNDAILTEEIDPQLFKDCVKSKTITKITFNRIK